VESSTSSTGTATFIAVNKALILNYAKVGAMRRRYASLHAALRGLKRLELVPRHLRSLFIPLLSAHLRGQLEDLFWIEVFGVAAQLSGNRLRS
jgi:hypothetical protein